MTIVQLDKSVETIQSLDTDEYGKVYFLALAETKTRSGSGNYTFRSKRLDCLRIFDIMEYLDNPEYILVKIEK